MTRVGTEILDFKGGGAMLNNRLTRMIVPKMCIVVAPVFLFDSSADCGRLVTCSLFVFNFDTCVCGFSL